MPSKKRRAHKKTPSRKKRANFNKKKEGTPSIFRIKKLGALLLCYANNQLLNERVQIWWTYKTNKFIPRRELRKQWPEGSTWQCFHFKMWLRSENWSFDFGVVIRLFKILKTFIFRMGGWVVIKRVLQFCLFLSMLTSKMSWLQKLCQKLSMLFYQKLWALQIFKLWQKPFKGNQLQKIIDEICVWALRKIIKVFQKNPIDKMWFHEQKYEKYVKPKKDIKRPLWPFNKELWAI